MQILPISTSSPAWNSPENLGEKPPGPLGTFARSVLHDVTCGWDERAGALGRGALSELRQLPHVIRGRKSWREVNAEAHRISRDALERLRRSREAGNRAYPFAASAGGLLPEVALVVLSGGLFATPMAQGAMAASKSLAESPEDLATIEGLKIAVPRAGVAGGSALALAKGAQVLQRG